MKLILALFLISFSFFGQENEEPAEPFDPVAEQEILKNQYVLRFNQMINKECRIVLYMNQDSSSLILKSFSSDQEDEFRNIVMNPSSIQNYPGQSYDLSQTLKGESKNHIFSYEDGDIHIQYNLLKNGALSEYEKRKAILFKNPTCIRP